MAANVFSRGAFMGRFEIREKFYLDGKPFQIISGAIHYFRVVPEYWKDRLEKAKAMGLNTVETYIPWNFHETEKGEFLWTGMHDFEKFIDIAKDLGLYVIVRPSPYICAEWEWGGLPSWLLSEKGMKVRCMYEPFLRHVREYYEQLIPRIARHQIDAGGNVILVQIENEYGYFANDTDYLRWLKNLMTELGITVPYVTSDGPWGAAFRTGQVEGVLPTGNFGANCKKKFGMMKPFVQGEKPLMNMEFWAGWFSAWGNKFKIRSILSMNVKDYDYAIGNGHNINIYMFHGGTNFGFMNGSNYYGHLTPDTTSYDYDAPVSEDGSLTKKYWAFRKVIEKNLGKVPEMKFSTEIKKIAYGKIFWSKKADLFENLGVFSNPKASGFPISMEESGQNYGYILYRTKLKPDEAASKLIFKKCADRIIAFSDGKKLFTAFDKEISNEGGGLWPLNYREGKVWKVNTAKGATLDFLVENLGRVNFGHKLEEQQKGLLADVLIDGHAHFGWEIYNLPLDDSGMNELLERGKWKTAAQTEKSESPSFYIYDFDVDEPGDTFLDFKGWGKGCVFVNGFNIGRFWSVGPQRRLYIPAPLLKKGDNRIVMFETEGKTAPYVELCSEMKW